MKSLKVLFLLCGLLTFGLTYGQDAPPANRQGRGAEMAKQRQAQYEKLVASLNLSEDQTVAMKEIDEDYRAQMKTAREEADGDREVMRETMQKLRKAQTAELKDILTAEQFTAYEAFLKEQRENRGRRGPGQKQPNN